MNLYREIYQFLKEEEKKDEKGKFKTYYPVTISIEGQDDQYLQLPAGRIISLVKTNPSNSILSFEDLEEDEPYEVKKKIKRGPGGYVILDEPADKKTTVSLDSKEGSIQTRAAKEKSLKKDYSRGVNVNPEGLKSTHKPGSVHKITFNTLYYSRSLRKPYTVYRKISQEEYNNLKTKSNKKVEFLITPDDSPEHIEDLYYITLPKKVYGDRSGKDLTYIIYLPKKAVDDLNADQKNKLKLRLVPLEDMMKGLSILTLTPSEVAKYLSSDPDKEKKLSRIYKKRPAKDDDIKPLDIDLSFLVSGEPSDSDIEKTVPPEEKQKDLAAGKVFLSIDADTLYKRMVRFYTDKKNSIENKDKKAEAEADKNLVAGVKDFVDLVFDKLDKESERDLLISDVLKDQITKDKKLGLYNYIKTRYDIMKSLKESFLKEATNLYTLKTKPGSVADKQFSKSKTAKKPKDGQPGEYIVALDDKQYRNLNSAGALESGVISLTPYTKPEKEKEKDSEEEKGTSKKFDDPKTGLYKVKLNLGGGSREAKLSPKEIMQFVRKSPGSEDLSFDDVEEKVYDFEKKVDPKVGPSIKGSIEILSKTPIGSGDKTKVVTTFRADTEKEKAKQDKEKEKAAQAAIKASQPEMKTVRFMGRDIKVPVNYSKDVLKIPMATPSNTDLIYKYYLVDMSDSEYPNGRLVRAADGSPLGTDDRAEAKATAARMGFQVYQKAELSAKKVELKEELTNKDKKDVVSKAVSFKIEKAQSNDPDSVAEVEGRVDNASYNEKEKELVITLDNGSQAIFKGSKSGNVTGVYNDLKSVKKINDVQGLLKDLLDKVFPTPAAESKLEAYIRKRIQQAIQEAEVSQYWGYQGKDVKKKRLEEYMKKYEWGFQDSDNPYTHAMGSEKHAIVSKLVHELGDEGVSIFNSYAPKGYEIAEPNDLNDMADSPLGSQLTQPYNPDSLTARGGRVAEMNGPVPTKKQGIDQLDRLVKDSNEKIKAAVKSKASSKDAKDILTVFRQMSDISDEVTDEQIYQKFKTA